LFRGFTQKKVHSYTLGEQLKNLRSEGRITLSEISRETKIPVKYLEMIEEGRYDSLPPDVYVRGFLKRYADFFGIAPSKIIGLYDREKTIRMNLNGGRKEEVKKKKPVRYVVSAKMTFAALIFLVVLGGFFYLYRQIGRFAAEPRLVIFNPAGDETIEGNSISISGITDDDAELSINGQPVTVNDRGEFRENILLQEGVNTITIDSVNRFSKTASKKININSKYQAPEIAAGGEGGKVSGEEDERKIKTSVTLRVDSSPVWISVEADGNLVYSGTMLPGAVQDFEGEKEVRITSGKANKTFIRVNGKDEKVLADTPGIVRDVVFTVND